MSKKQLTGDEAFAELERLEVVQEPSAREVPDVQEDTPQGEELTLPVGYELKADLRQGHLLDFWEAQNKGKERYESMMGIAQNTIEAAVSAGWFSKPSIFVQAANKPEMMGDATNAVRDLTWGEVFAISSIVSRRFTEAIVLKKK